MKKFYSIIIVLIIIIICFNLNYKEIPEDSIRIRIIPSSNGVHDKRVKIILKNNLDKIIYPIIKDAKDAQDASRKLDASKSLIEKKVKTVLDQNSIKEKFTIDLGLNYFPEKKYKNFIYKSGEYNSLVIKLGNAKGDNYWCVLYPPMCLVNEDKKIYEYHFLIKDILKNIIS